jgi:hypothetical protein
VGGGAANVLYGSSSGLTATGDQFWSQDSPEVNGVAESGDEFGSALAGGDFNGDGRDDLAIGVRAEDFGQASNGGGVNVIYGSSSGLSATAVPDQFWYQDTTDVAGVAEDYDEFGSSLAAEDANGDGRDDLAIGVPLEDQAARTDSGGVNLIHGSSTGLSATSVPDQYWSQDSGGILDTSENDDHFGAALAFGRFTPDVYADLAVGVDHEDLGVWGSAGAVNVLYGSSAGLSATGDQFWNQDSPDVEEAARDSDLFGAALSTGDFNQDGREDLAIGVPRETYPYWYVDELDQGAVNVLHGTSTGLTATGPPADQYWYQDSPNVDGMAEFNDWFGSAVSAAG